MKLLFIYRSHVHEPEMTQGVCTESPGIRFGRYTNIETRKDATAETRYIIVLRGDLQN